MENKYLTFGLYVTVCVLFNLIQSLKNSMNTINLKKLSELFFHILFFNFLITA